MSGFPVTFRLTSKNRSSVAAVLAVLEEELPGMVETRLLDHPEEFGGEGLLAYSFTSRAARSVAAELAGLRQRLGERLRVVAGGCHASADPQGTLAMGFCWAAVGEAGGGFAQLVLGLAEGREPPAGVIAAGGAPPLDRYPPFPRSGQLYSHLEITRGCPMACAFCQTPRLFGRIPRHRSLQSIRRALEQAVAKGHRYVRFVAPNAFGYGSRDGLRPDFHPIEALLEVARAAGLAEVYLGTFPSEVRPESVTAELLQLVKERCANRSIALGAQSGSADVLRAIRRGHTVEQAVKAIALIARAGLRPKVDFIFGFPGETDEDRRLTRDLVTHLVAEYGAQIHSHLFEPLPGSPLAASIATPLDAQTRDLLAELAGQGHLTGVDVSERDSP
jgi:B12-binding domain/radical SAM domain protein